MYTIIHGNKHISIRKNKQDMGRPQSDIGKCTQKIGLYQKILDNDKIGMNWNLRGALEMRRKPALKCRILPMGICEKCLVTKGCKRLQKVVK